MSELTPIELPDFLIHKDSELIITAYIYGTNVTEEWNNYLQARQAKHKEELKKAFDAGVTSDTMYFPEQHEEEAFNKWYKEYHDNKESGVN